MFTVYVLQGSMGRFYKGMTENLDRRLAEHRAGETKTTRTMRNICVVYTETTEAAAEARKREKYLKSGAGRRFLKSRLQSDSIRP